MGEKASGVRSEGLHSIKYATNEGLLNRNHRAEAERWGYYGGGERDTWALGTIQVRRVAHSHIATLSLLPEGAFWLLGTIFGYGCEIAPIGGLGWDGSVGRQR